jgi:protocatechuate 3,4-dioxygenase beta subunit
MLRRRIFISLFSALVIVAAIIPLGFLGWRFLAGRFPAAGTARDGEATGVKSGTAAGPADDRTASEDSGREEEDRTAGGVRSEPVSIEGLVTGDDSRPVPGACVAVQEKRAWIGTLEKRQEDVWTDPFRTIRGLCESLAALTPRKPSAETGADGVYRVRGLHEGEYRVSVSHPDFLPYRGGDWVVVEAGKTTRHDVGLIPGLRISGRVVDVRGKAVPGARVRALPSEAARLRGIGKMVQVVVDGAEGKLLGWAGTAEADAKGAFTISSLEPGSHDLRASKDGYAWKEARGVPAGARGIVIALGPGIPVTGRVVGPDGAPVPRAAVVLRDVEWKIDGRASILALALADPDLSGERERRGASGEDGRFQLDAFTAGSFEMTIRAEGYLLHRRSLTLEGKGARLGDIALAEARAIAGRVLGPDNAPVEGAQVWIPPAAARVKSINRKIQILYNGPSSSIASGTTDRAGSFRLSGIDAGTWEIAARAAGLEDAVLEGIPAGESAVEIRLDIALHIPGKALDAETGDPVSGVKVSTSWDWDFPEALTDTDGNFDLTGVPRQAWEGSGSLRLWARREGYEDGYARVPPPKDGADAEPVEIRLRQHHDEIQGIVRDPTGAPVSNARVWIEVAGFPRAVMSFVRVDGSREARTDEDGTFALSPPKQRDITFEVVASRPGLARGRSGPLMRPEGNAALPPVEIRLSTGSSIEGRVIGADGLPLARARVRAWREARITGEAAIYARLIPRGAGGETVWSGKDGGFRLGGIEPGSWLLEATATGYATGSAGPVEVSEGPAQVDLVLVPGGSLKGRVVDHEGNPLAGVEVVAILAAGSGEEGGPELDEELLRRGELGVAETKTGEGGTYEMAHLPEGEFRLVARAAGFVPGEVAPATPGQPAPDIVLQPFSRIAGIVTDVATRQPVTEFEVFVQMKSVEGTYEEKRELHRAVADAEGRLAYDSLEPGEYRFVVYGPDHVIRLVPVRLDAGKEVELKIALDPGLRVEGMVRTGDGEPVGGAVVYAQRTEESPERRRLHFSPAPTSEDGKFVLKSLEAGEYRAFIRHADCFQFVDPDPFLSIAFRAPVAAPLELVVVRGGRLQGRLKDIPPLKEGERFTVVFAEHLALRNDEVGKAEGKDGEALRWVGEATVDIPSGEFQEDCLKPGKYTLLLLRHAPSEEGKPDPSPEQRILGEMEIRAGEEIRFEASLR